MKKILLLVSSVFLINTAYAQAESDAQKISTKLEAFQAKTGVVLIKGYTNVGVLKEHGSTRVVAHDLRDASNPKVRFTGISITLTYSDEWESRAYFDVDDIDSLIAGDFNTSFMNTFDLTE